MVTTRGDKRRTGQRDFHIKTCSETKPKAPPERTFQCRTLHDASLKCQPGTLVLEVHRELRPHVTLSHLLTHLGCVYNRSM
jgi:hypothetical protein